MVKLKSLMDTEPNSAKLRDEAMKCQGVSELKKTIENDIQQLGAKLLSKLGVIKFGVFATMQSLGDDSVLSPVLELKIITSEGVKTSLDMFAYDFIKDYAYTANKGKKSKTEVLMKLIKLTTGELDI